VALGILGVAIATITYDVFANAVEKLKEETKVTPSTTPTTITGNPDPNDPCNNWQKKVRSLRKCAQEYAQKLGEYSRDPFAFDNRGILQDADPLRQQGIVQGRQNYLQQEIDNFNAQADELEERCG
jgi:hypothetical protein